MTEDERTLESLKLLRESSAWMVGVQTAIFGFLITLLNSGQLKLGSFLIKVAITAFGLSIVCAGIVLGAVPWVLSRKSMPSSVQQAPIADWPLVNKISIGWVSGFQYLAFVIGLVSLGSAVIWKQIG
ncbi:hypothetical protein ACJJI5_03410 [Microbulbifer sp. EKSA008]|uniref:hypothetical protein n=1 Tax=unclassified Microbulbifer TaxID=2619833 RepID=UPI00403AE5F2